MKKMLTKLSLSLKMTPVRSLVLWSRGLVHIHIGQENHSWVLLLLSLVAWERPFLSTGLCAKTLAAKQPLRKYREIIFCYCEKKLFYWSRKIFKNFQITRAICLNSERLEQFLVTECLFNLFLEVSQTW